MCAFPESVVSLWQTVNQKNLGTITPKNHFDCKKPLNHAKCPPLNLINLDGHKDLHVTYVRHNNHCNKQVFGFQ